MNIDPIERSQGKIFVSSCAKCKGSEELYLDETGYYRKCLNCGRISHDSTPVPAKKQTPYQVMEQARLDGF